MKFGIRLLYLYLFSAIGLIIAVIGTVQLADLAIKVFVFKGADRFDAYDYSMKIGPDGRALDLTESEKREQMKMRDTETNRQRQRQASTAIAMLVVGFPLYKYHWELIKKEGKKKN